MSLKFSKNPDNTLYIYSRVSSSNQSNEGVSLSVQSDRGRKISKILGFSPKVIEEQGSGLKPFSDTRPQFLELYDGITDSLIKNVWIDEETRLTRSDIDQTMIYYEMKKHKVNLYVGNSEEPKKWNFITDLVDSIVTKVNQEQIRTQVKKSIRSKIRQFNDGYYVLSVTPFGYDKYKVGSGKKIKVNKTKGGVVRTIFEMFSKQKTILEIQSYLLSNGIKSPRGKHEWNLESIRNILKNTLYIGDTSYTDTTTSITHKNTCVPIVDMKVWYQVQNRFLYYSNETQQIRKQKHSYLLTPFLFCGVCGYKVRGRKNPKKYENIYYCGTKEMNNDRPQKKYCDTNRNKSVNIDRLDNLVWNEILETIRESKVLRELKKSTILQVEGEKGEDLVKEKLLETKKQLRFLKKSRTEQQKKLSKLWKFYVHDVYEDDKEFNELLQLQKQKLFDLENDIKDTETLIDSFHESNHWIDWLKVYTDKVERWSKITDINQKKEILKEYVQKILISYDKEKDLHNIVIKLRLHLFNDKVVIKSQTKRHENGKVVKPREYEVIEGGKTKDLILTKTKVGNKKSLNYSNDFNPFLVGNNPNVIKIPPTKQVTNP